MKLIVGLGNPDPKYLKTRHNIGFMALDAFAKRCFVLHWKNDQLVHAQLTETTINSEKIILAKPTTYMNNSGIAVSSLLGKYKLTSKDLTVIHDELDLPFGVVKISHGGSSAGHNGIQSIIETLKTEDFTRLRCGIGKPDLTDIPGSAKKDFISNFVLMPFSKDQQKGLNEMIKQTTTLLLNNL